MKDVGLRNHLKEYGTPLPPCCAPFDQPKTFNGHSTRTSKAVQMTQNWAILLCSSCYAFLSGHHSRAKYDTHVCEWCEEFA